MTRTVAKSIGNCKTSPDLGWELEAVDAKVASIRALIPLGLQAVQGTLDAEVTALAGARYQRDGRQPGHVRWSQQQGSVLGDQKLPVRFPRVRNVQTNAEVPLVTYERLQRPRDLDDGLLRRVLVGLSCERYRECAEAAPQAFGMAPATVSRRFVRASARWLRTLLGRDL